MPESFISAPDGSDNFGEITQDMAKAMKRQAGKIRLQQGNDQFGLIHIEKRHGTQIQALGFADVRAFVVDALSKIDTVWKPDTTSQLVVIQSDGKGRAVFIQLKPAEVMARGVSRLTPWDVSRRVGLDSMILPDVQEGLQGKRLAESAMSAALGPVAGIGANVLKGMQEISEGRLTLGLETMMPAVLRGPMKALRYEQDGARDKSGIVIKDEVSAGGIIGQALGFAPSEVRNATEGRSAIFSADKRLGERRSDLLDQYANAHMKQDAEGMDEARADIQKFNEKNPGRRINGLQLMQSVRNRQRRIDQAKDGIYLSKNRNDARLAGQFAVME